MAGFPIFIEFGRVPPLVVGSTPLAVIKSRLLLKRAASVTFAADLITPDVQMLLDEGLAEVIARSVGEAQIKGRPLVISASGCDDEDARNSDLARSLGVPVNVPDRPHLCTFSLAAIVDRGTVTVAIGTEGAAPVLATQLRARLEQELHPRLGRLADVAREYRAAVAERLPPGPSRRAFWDDAFAGAIAAAILSGDEQRGRDLIEARLAGIDANQRKAGRVLLVGAGPGDPELLTLKAVRALKSADVILHDGHVSAGVLEYARREAQIISVAKARGRHSKTQAEINALIVALATEGKTVVRLKGGDPLVFGRGGEEIDILRSSGIAVDVIPGITAATAASASLQIPLTHRDMSRSVTFISGHAAGDGAPEFDQVDFAALAKGRATLAVYMGLATAGMLATTLIDAGWSPATPIIAIERASQPNERRVATSLDRLAQDAKCLGLSGPTLLLVGEITSLPAAGPIIHLDRMPVQAQQPEAAFA
jgi:uroporphyrin-III C-methyltransferase / precorrin-2 dehydrogenase / sirohydrochlorin ferrochelatase